MAVTAHELGAKRASVALAEMARHRVPITPPNYTLWYEHVARANEELSGAIEGLIARGGALSDDALSELHARFFSAPPASLTHLDADASGALRKMLDGVRKMVASACTKFGGYGDTLDRFVEDMCEEPSVGQLTQMVGELVSRTSELREETSQLQLDLIERAAQVQSLQLQLEETAAAAVTDHLTQLPNRQVFERTLEEMARTALHGSHSPTLILVDIDRFKSVNDRYGHLIGDKVLRIVARTLKECVRGGDLVTRWGGEEFAILLLNTPRSGALTVAEAIRTALASRPILDEDGMVLIDRITASLGVSWFRSEESFDNFIDRADRALYRAKQGGRNRVVDENH